MALFSRCLGEETRTMSVLLLSSTEDVDSHASLIGLRSAGGHIMSITQDVALSAVFSFACCAFSSLRCWSMWTRECASMHLYWLVQLLVIAPVIFKVPQGGSDTSCLVHHVPLATAYSSCFDRFAFGLWETEAASPAVICCARDDTLIHSADSSASARCGYTIRVVTHAECASCASFKASAW